MGKILTKYEDQQSRSICQYVLFIDETNLNIISKYTCHFIIYAREKINEIHYHCYTVALRKLLQMEEQFINLGF